MTTPDLIPRFEFKVTFGNLMTLSTVALGIVFGYWDLRRDSDDLQKEVEELRALVVAIQADRATAQANAEARFRALEVSEARASTQLSNILAGITRIEARLDRVEGESRR